MESLLDRCHFGDCLNTMQAWPDSFIQTCVTSPPYWGLRDYGVPGQFGLEKDPEEYVDKMVKVFHEVRRVLQDDGTLWLNLGDTYASAPRGNTGLLSGLTNNGQYQAEKKQRTYSTIVDGLKSKDLVGIPWLVAFALRADGWYLRSDIIWAKANCMPESVTDRPTRSHEYLFLLTKSPRYYYDFEAIKEPAIYDLDGKGTAARKARQKLDAKSMPTSERHGIRPPNPDKQRGHSRQHKGALDDGSHTEQRIGMRNKRDVWTVAPACYPEAHFATFPVKLIQPCILAGSRPGDVVLDPFLGSGTTAEVAMSYGRRWIGCELNPAYSKLQDKRTIKTGLGL